MMESSLQRSSIAAAARQWLLAAVLIAGPSGPKAWGDEVPSGTRETQSANPVDESAVRDSVARALPFIARQGVKWMDEKRCVTCHHTTFLVWSHNAAVERGFNVDAAKLAEWSAWARDHRNLLGPNAKDAETATSETTFPAHPDEVGQLLLGRASIAAPHDDEAAPSQWALDLRAHLLAGQQPDGLWKPGGQLPSQKRPQRETEEVTTLWALTALRSVQPPDDAVSAAEARVNAWLGGATEGVSTEWWAVRLLAARGQGRADVADASRERLLQSQHADGGWGWLTADAGDALGTGLALYALQRDGLTRDDAAVQRGISFLASTQRDDGAWPVPGTKQNRRDRMEPTATYWGTCWAAIALLESLPRSPRSVP